MASSCPPKGMDWLGTERGVAWGAGGWQLREPAKKIISHLAQPSGKDRDSVPYLWLQGVGHRSLMVQVTPSLRGGGVGRGNVKILMQLLHEPPRPSRRQWSGTPPHLWLLFTQPPQAVFSSPLPTLSRLDVLLLPLQVSSQPYALCGETGVYAPHQQAPMSSLPMGSPTRRLARGGGSEVRVFMLPLCRSLCQLPRSGSITFI